MSNTHSPASSGIPLGSILRTSICLTLGLIGLVLQLAFPTGDLRWDWLVFAGAYLAGGWDSAKKTIEGLRHGQWNVDLLMIVAAIGAAIIGEWFEGTVLLFLFSLSGTLEEFAMYRTSKSIESLIRLRPQEAWLVSDSSSEDQRVAVDSLELGDVVRVRPGEGVPVDGVVTSGESWLNESTLTGESELIVKAPGDQVYAGTMNSQGSLTVRMTKASSDTSIAKIVSMVQLAQSQKTPTQYLVESWQRPYVIGVLALACFALIGGRFILFLDWHTAFYRAMVLLVSASPCAVVVGSPAVMLSAIARAGRNGILFKGAANLERLGKIDVLALDKTGTITVGKPVVISYWTAPCVDSNRLLSLAAAIEKSSEHPLAIPVLEEIQKRGLAIESGNVKDFYSHTGLGVQGKINDIWIGIGNEKLFDHLHISLPSELVEEAQRIRGRGQTCLIIASSMEGLCGAIGVSDQIRPKASSAIQAIKRQGIQHIVMLTGDHPRVGKMIGQQVNVDDVKAGLLPEDKVRELCKLGENGRLVAMVGDGVNDAPALAAAHVGIAMGGAGTDVALDVADVVLMRDDLSSLPLAIWLSRTAIRRVRQNMIFAFGMIAVLVLSTFFHLPLWLGVIGHEGSTVIVIFNGLRILWERLPKLV